MLTCYSTRSFERVSTYSDSLPSLLFLPGRRSVERRVALLTISVNNLERRRQPHPKQNRNHPLQHEVEAVGEVEVGVLMLLHQQRFHKMVTPRPQSIHRELDVVQGVVVVEQFEYLFLHLYLKKSLI